MDVPRKKSIPIDSQGIWRQSNAQMKGITMHLLWEICREHHWKSAIDQTIKIDAYLFAQSRLKRIEATAQNEIHIGLGPAECRAQQKRPGSQRGRKAWSQAWPSFGFHWCPSKKGELACCLKDWHDLAKKKCINSCDFLSNLSPLNSSALTLWKRFEKFVLSGWGTARHKAIFFTFESWFQEGIGEAQSLEHRVHDRFSIFGLHLSNKTISNRLPHPMILPGSGKLTKVPKPYSNHQ